jgi:hypothetical protein
LKKRNFLILILLFLSLILAILTNIVYASYLNKTSLEKSINEINKNNEKEIFSINKIVYFSSCSANADISNSNFMINNLFQYTDIAIYINNDFENLSLENTLKSVYIDNVNFTTSPEIGTPSLYFKNLNNFATDIYLKENKISDKLFFDVTSEDSIDYSEAILYNNCANPITLSYVNENIKTDYVVSNISNPIIYDGSLLKKSNILLNSISCSISFDIYITNNLDEEFKCPVYLNIPLDNETASIYDGSLTLVDNTNYVFYRYK